MYRIAVIGPESSGKSTISKYIAKEFDAVLVEEYAREYLLNLDNPTKYSIEDLIKIAKVQYDKSIHTIDSRNKICICDTEILTVKIWAEDKFNNCPDEICEWFFSSEVLIYEVWVSDPAYH